LQVLVALLVALICKMLGLSCLITGLFHFENYTELVTWVKDKCAPCIGKCLASCWSACAGRCCGCCKKKESAPADEQEVSLSLSLSLSLFLSFSLSLSLCTSSVRAQTHTHTPHQYACIAWDVRCVQHTSYGLCNTHHIPSYTLGNLPHQE